MTILQNNQKKCVNNNVISQKKHYFCKCVVIPSGRNDTRHIEKSINYYFAFTGKASETYLGIQTP